MPDNPEHNYNRAAGPSLTSFKPGQSIRMFDHHTKLLEHSGEGDVTLSVLCDIRVTGLIMLIYACSMHIRLVYSVQELTE